MATLRERLDRMSIPEPNSGCLLWLGSVMGIGYGKISLHGKSFPAHREAWKLAKGPIPVGLFICHKCDVPSCINPDHLFLGTPADNMTDKIAKGRQSHGEKHPSSKLTQSQVLAILADPRKNCTMAAELGVSFRTISDIRRRKRWQRL